MANPEHNLNEQFKRLTEIQARSLEPFRIYGGLAADTMEQLVRKHYAVMGDVVEYSVKQVHLPLGGDSAGDVLAAQISEASAFGEQMGARTTEYVELANNFGHRMRQAADDATEALKTA